ncbi:MAG: transposase [Christensenellaceae bacterium]|nr:transposase [Christensenellaceae bacterium]
MISGFRPKLCHVCGYVATDRHYGRSWTCESCGAHHHRDIN